jgi:MFS transporter, DHA1 family, multidrug resistance protein
MVILLGSLTAFAAMSIDMYLPSLPSIDAGFHARAGAAQATMAAFFVGLAVGQFFYGPASDRWGRRGPLFAGVALYAVASAWCALAPSLGMLTVARFFQALGGCAGPVIAGPWCATGSITASRRASSRSSCWSWAWPPSSPRWRAERCSRSAAGG